MYFLEEDSFHNVCTVCIIYVNVYHYYVYDANKINKTNLKKNHAYNIIHTIN